MASAIVSRPVSSTRNVATFAWAVLAFFILVVLWGAVVRATGSGGGCGSNWPLCNGDFFPQHPRLATMIEFAHRSTSGVSVFLTLALGVWTFRRTPPGHSARRAISLAGFFLFTEALLGAALVLRHWVENNVSTGRTIAQSVHFTNTLLLMGALAVTAWCLQPLPATHVVRNLGTRRIAVAAIVATILIGATGSLAALADTLFPSPNLQAALAADFAAGAPILIRMRWLHPAMTAVGFVCVCVLLRMEKKPGAKWSRLSLTVFGLLLSQLVLGSLDVLLLAPTWMQVLHLLGADLYWVALVVWVSQILGVEGRFIQKTATHRWRARTRGTNADSLRE